ncbi:aminotransferase class III-fold pyridoxal phosphate-dependent enzyme [Pseudosulfitobacter pseudonitzschiae]|uniref:aminotransferase class III-fold pyridoxal phosphate-dependent enzyme n=1 Tax=Pseudosulfitobacter pseudonitzschiae TaxID=1402135 RepID=UPI001AF9BA9C|nr:aminotransferase class III-fold pyridoxal phosphate-dependent enzyme [Pseudosulfitobacter pseudonitzschiae]MBM1816741.1 aminotransferase class III-fold pyridoxal phosphate-dependent enzyme [Pseudosulfitobacter pseudonitzschiae]MBM1833551.1 aminotransferase class III-fold pyridoxal phosphate-dependent enzyme [Pseudosulfitobacter pseudonitzschiae]MBM1838418.1 aminotransferase class III-fold pyridoxal phosphate-dependent enzyme [Pseudosulfitobacter pseudonitzschiae]MBM1843468.1 aminotransferase
MKDSNFLKENNGRVFWHPMTSPEDSIKNPPKIITASNGVRISDIDGHEVVDAVGGLWNVNLGYSCAPVKDAIAAQLERLPYYSTFRGSSNDAAIELAFELGEFFAPEGVTRAFFTSGGSDSVETALRLARQYHKLRGDSGRVKFLSLKKGYHGTHFGGASVNGNANFRTAYEPLMPGCHHIPAPYTYRNPFNESDPEKLAHLCVAALEDEIAFQGAGTIAAMIMEPILGAGGVIPPHKSFAPMVADVCKRNGILLITDEVITAYGRTGAWSGARLWGIKPDMMCTAKAITNGYFPFGALMIGEQMQEVFENNPAAKIGHGYTYSGHPVGAAAALACLAETKRLNVVDNAAARGDQLYQGCLALQEKYDIIGDVRGGHGLMTAIEMVSDRATKAPIDAASAMKVQEVAYQSGAMVRVSGPNLILSPPLVLTEADATAILDALDAGFAAL